MQACRVFEKPTCLQYDVIVACRLVSVATERVGKLIQIIPGFELALVFADTHGPQLGQLSEHPWLSANSKELEAILDIFEEMGAACDALTLAQRSSLGGMTLLQLQFPLWRNTDHDCIRGSGLLDEIGAAVFWFVEHDAMAGRRSRDLEHYTDQEMFRLAANRPVCTEMGLAQGAPCCHSPVLDNTPFADFGCVPERCAGYERGKGSQVGSPFVHRGRSQFPSRKRGLSPVLQGPGTEMAPSVPLRDPSTAVSSIKWPQPVRPQECHDRCSGVTGCARFSWAADSCSWACTCERPPQRASKRILDLQWYGSLVLHIHVYLHSARRAPDPR